MNNCLVTKLKGTVDNNNLPVYDTVVIRLDNVVENLQQDDLYFHVRSLEPLQISTTAGYTRIFADSHEEAYTSEILPANGYTRGRLNNIKGNTLTFKSAYKGIKGFILNAGFKNATIIGLDSAGVYGDMQGIQFSFDGGSNPIDITNYKNLYCAVENGGSINAKGFTVSDWNTFAANNPGLKYIYTRGIAVPLEAFSTLSDIQNIARCKGNIESINSNALVSITFGFAEVQTGTIEGLIANIRAAKIAAGIEPSGVIRVTYNYTSNNTITFQGLPIVDSWTTGTTYFIHYTADTITIDTDATGYVGPNIPENNWV